MLKNCELQTEFYEIKVSSQCLKKPDVFLVNYCFSVPNYLTDDHSVFAGVLFNLEQYLIECKNESL